MLSCRMGSKVPSAVVVKASPDRHEVMHIAERAESCHGPHRDDRTEHPACDGQFAGLLAQQQRVELVSGEQEQESQPHVGKQLDAGGVGEPQALRADQDAAQDQDDYLGDARPGKRGAHDRCQRGYQHHYQQRVEALGVHLGDPLSQEPRRLSQQANVPSNARVRPGRARRGSAEDSNRYAAYAASRHIFGRCVLRD